MSLNNYEQDLHNTLDEMGTILGQLFQRSDDLLDFDIRNDEGKAILGDLKSGYLNSFGSYVAQNLNRTQIDQMIKSQNLADYCKALSPDMLEGQNIFSKNVSEFDEQNLKLIDLYEHHLEQLNLKIKSAELIKALKPLTEILYWRRKPKS